MPVPPRQKKSSVNVSSEVSTVSTNIPPSSPLGLLDAPKILSSTEKYFNQLSRKSILNLLNLIHLYRLDARNQFGSLLPKLLEAGNLTPAECIALAKCIRVLSYLPEKNLHDQLIQSTVECLPKSTANVSILLALDNNARNAPSFCSRIYRSESQISNLYPTSVSA